MTTARDIADTLGRDAMATTLGVGKTAVSNAVVRGRFPASWYLLTQGLCRERGIDCPPELFGMKLRTQDVGDAAEDQGEGRGDPPVAAE